MGDSYDARHFSLANPREDGAADLPRLLRRLAEEIDTRRIDAMDILDLTVAQEMTVDGPWWSATIYWAPDTEARANGDGS